MVPDFSKGFYHLVNNGYHLFMHNCAWHCAKELRCIISFAIHTNFFEADTALISIWYKLKVNGSPEGGTCSQLQSLLCNSVVVWRFNSVHENMTKNSRWYIIKAQKVVTDQAASIRLGDLREDIPEEMGPTLDLGGGLSSRDCGGWSRGTMWETAWWRWTCLNLRT